MQGNFINGGLAKYANIFYEIIRGIPPLSYYSINTIEKGDGDITEI